jgi:uncharacterized protein YegL
MKDDIAANRGINLEVVLLIDSSASMFGEPIEALKESYRLVVSALQAVLPEVVGYSVIQFDSQPQLLFDCVETLMSELPTIILGGCSNLGRAWSLVGERLEHLDDSHLWCFLMTDGPGTDNWDVAGRVLTTFGERFSQFGIPCGLQANLDTLMPYLTTILPLTQYDQMSLETFVHKQIQLAWGGEQHG